jgi:hypothetical protein
MNNVIDWVFDETNRLRSTLKRIDVYVILWARRKYRRLRHKAKGGGELPVDPTRHVTIPSWGRYSPSRQSVICSALPSPGSFSLAVVGGSGREERRAALSWPLASPPK